MVMASLAPLFLLWAIRGAANVPDKWWILFCLLAVIVPNLVLLARWRIAAVNQDHRTIIVRSAKDQSEHLLIYLFAMLIPLFGVDLGSVRVTASVLVAFLLIVFIFWHMNLHYVNIVFALFGYRVFTVEAAKSRDDHGATTTVVLLSKQHSIPPNREIKAIRLSNTVLIDRG
jgi:hypothetical protein